MALDEDNSFIRTRGPGHLILEWSRRQLKDFLYISRKKFDLVRESNFAVVYTIDDDST